VSAAPKEVTLTIDETRLTVPEGTLLVEAAKKVKTDIPVYCYHPKLGPAGLCRICLVDVEKTPKLQIACNTTVAEGMVVHTYGPKVEDGRRAVLEFLLLNHPLDCPICDKGGECDLQDYSIAYGQGASRLADPKEMKPKAIDLGPTIVLDEERCIVCQRCTRFDEIITLERSLVVKDRGQRDVIATATGQPYVSMFSGNVTELCPVGALTSKTYRFKSRPWDLNRSLTTCVQCSAGCAINVDERHGEILRTMSVAGDDAVSEGWLCDRGRYNVGFYSDPRRLTSPLYRQNDEWVQLSWDDAIDLWATSLRESVAAAGPKAIAALGGGRLTNEEACLIAHVFRALGSQNVDWRVGRQRQASPGPRGGTYADLEFAQAIVLAGVPAAQTAPIVSLRIRKAVSQHGARMILVGDHALPIQVAHDRAARLSDLASFGLERYERIAFCWDGIDGAVGAELNEIVESLSAGRKIATFVTSETPNARGAEAMGLFPRDGGADAPAILEGARAGTLRSLAIFAANPILHAPGGADAVRAALERVPFVVTTELFLTPTAECSTLLLPARGPFEKGGHTFDLTGAVRVLRPGVAAPAGTLSDLEILIALASALGVEIPDHVELHRQAAGDAPWVASGLGDPALFGERERSAPRAGAASGLRLVIAADPFSGGGTVYHDESLAELRPRPAAALTERTAAAAQVRDGDVIDIVAGERTLPNLTVRIAANVIDGTVRVVAGLPAASASAFVGGETVELTNIRSAPVPAGVA